MEKIILVEGSEQFNKIRAGLLDKAKNCTIGTLDSFVKGLVENYEHDYGTICHITAIAAMAAAHAINSSPQGGITGFQASAIMWQFIKDWSYPDNKVGMMLLNYDDLLFPQYAYKHQRVLSRSTWLMLQEEAQRQINEADKKYADYLLAVEQYKKDIEAFIIKFPDYHERREFYDHLEIGTGEQWEKEREKEAEGFEFAPREPYCPLTQDSEVYRHWKSIVAGYVPFGYVVEGDR